MDLFELFREKQIRITPESQVTIKYITAGTTADLFSISEGDLLLVKKLITHEDLMFLNEYVGHCTVFTTPPLTLDEYDAVEQIRNIAEVHQLESAGLNYLHFGNTLLVFGEFDGSSTESTVPNAVCISPVHRDDIETQLAVNLEAIKAVLDEHDDVANQDLPEQINLFEEKHAPKKAPSVLEMVCEKLKKEFEKGYSVVKVEFTGTSIESRMIGLSGFYKKHGIAQGRLMGSWKLFDKSSIGESFDVGLARRAVDEVYSRLSVTVPGYGRIVREDKMEEFHSAMNWIEGDYRRYLSGKECRHVGGITVEKAFSPWSDINESLNALLDYLIEICPVKGLETEGYIQDVKEFIDIHRDELDHLADKVSLRITATSYKKSQWSDRTFVASLCQVTRKNPDFFDDEFRTLLKRCINLLDSAHKAE